MQCLLGYAFLMENNFHKELYTEQLILAMNTH